MRSRETAVLALFAAALAGAACTKDQDAPNPPGAADAGVVEPHPDAAVETPVEIGCATCTSFTGGMVFDGTRAGRGAVVIDGERVKGVVFGPVTVRTGTTVDLSGKSILPGLFDLHVHSPSSAGPSGYLPIDPNPYEPHFKAMLRAGVTSYLDLGTSERSIFEYRSRIGHGVLLAPRLFAAGPLVTATGGHPCYRGTPPGDACIFVDAPADADRLIPPLLADAPDVLKIVIESGVRGHALPQLAEDSMSRIRELATAAGVKTIAHVSEVDDVEIALRAGVRAFAHIPAEDLISEDLARRLHDLDVTIVPTLAVYESFHRLAHGDVPELDDPALADDVPGVVIQALKDPDYRARIADPSFRDWADRDFENAQDNLRTVAVAGVRIAAGTDAGNPGTFHGLAAARELALYVESGLDIISALQAGTKNAADFLGRAELGPLEEGALADLLIVEGDVSLDITALNHPVAVYRGGQELDRAGLALPNNASLALMDVGNIARGETCLGEGECASGLYCGYQDVCADECTFLMSCTLGQACFPEAGSTSRGFCYQGDGCDPRAQDCANGEACIWLGNGATLCWVAGTAVAGEPCDDASSCAPGFECDLQTVHCVALCDPTSTSSVTDCPGSTRCVDLTQQAGIAVGECH